MTPDDTTLAIAGASKTFNGIRVLDDVTLALHRGEITALIGQNGSGKSTLIKVLSGFHAPDPGAHVSMGGRDITSQLGAGPATTGLAFIHQDLALVPSMTILENLRIARFTTGLGGRIRWGVERAHVRAALLRVGLDTSPDRAVGELSVTERALVAIARGLADTGGLDDPSSGLAGARDDTAPLHGTRAAASDDPRPLHGTRAAAPSGGTGDAARAAPRADRVLVLDEPTAYLPRDGVQRLFEVLRALAERGVSVLFVSHRLDEVLENCHRAVVLRGGVLVADEPVAGRSERDLVELMLGRPPENMYPDTTPARPGAGLVVSGLAGQHVHDVSFAAAPGEMVGFVGLPGGGYDHIPYLLAGALTATAGIVTVDGASAEASSLTPRRARDGGVVLLPADRKGASGALALGVGENMTLPTLPDFTALRSVIMGRRERRAVDAEIDRFDVRPARADLPLASLSGGNQQKVLLAKSTMSQPRVLALHEPTQGVDVGAKADVFAHLGRLAAGGAVVLISSVEYEDLASLCTRVHVVAGGRIVRTLDGTLHAHDLAVAVYETATG